MSKLVDERVVTLTFNNKNFNRNVNDSIRQINDLKSSLNMSNSINQANSQINKLDTSVIANSVDKLKSGFSAFEVSAITVISNITNRLTNLGIAISKSLSVDNISSGMDKYTQLTKTQRTLMNMNEELVGSEENVANSLEKVMIYSDATSYSMSQMTDAMSQIVGTGRVELSESVDMVTGLANAAAVANIGITESSEVFRQWTQAVQRGVLISDDFRSLQSKGLFSDDFKRKAVEAATELGVLTQTVDGLYSVMVEGADSAKRFSISDLFTPGQDGGINEQWFNLDVMKAITAKFAAGYNELYQNMLEDASISTIEQALDKYGDSVEEFGKKAFLAAQESRSLSDVIVATRDAVSSGWSASFTRVFGDPDEATKMWSNLSSKLWDIFASGASERNAILDEWVSLKGRETIFGIAEDNQGALWNILDAIYNITQAVKDAFSQVFNPGGKSLYSFTQGLQKLTARLVESTEDMTTFKEILKGVFSVIKLFYNIIKALWKISKPIRDVFVSLLTVVSKVIGKLSEAFSKSVKRGKGVEKVTNAIGKAVNAVVNAITALFNKISNVQPIEKLKSALGSIKDSFKEVGNSASSLNVVDKIKNAFGKFSISASKSKEILEMDPGMKLNSPGDESEEELNDKKTTAKRVKQSKWLTYLYAEYSKLKDTLVIIKAYQERIKINLKQMWLFAKEMSKIVSNEISKETLKTFIKSLVNMLAASTKLMMSLFKIMTVMIDRLTEEITKLAEKINNDPKNNGIVIFFEGLLELFKGLLAIANGLLKVIGPLLKKIGELFTRIGNSIGEFGSGGLSRLSDALSKFKKGGGLKKLAAVLAGGSIVVILGSLAMFVVNLLKTIKIINAAAGGLVSLFKAPMMFAVASIIKSIARAILEIALAMLIISLIDPKKISEARVTVIMILAAIGLMIFMISQVIKKTNAEFSSEKDSFRGYVDTSSLIIFAISSVVNSLGKTMLYLAVAISILGQFKPSSLIKGTWTIMALMVAITGMIMAIMYMTKYMTITIESSGGLFNQVASLMATVKAISTIGWAIRSIGMTMLMLTASMVILGSMKMSDLWKGIFVMGTFAVIIGSLIWFIHSLTKNINQLKDKQEEVKSANKTLDTISTLLARFSKAIWSFAVSISLLAKLNSTNVMTGSLALIAVLTAMSIAIGIILLGLSMLQKQINKSDDSSKNISKELKAFGRLIDKLVVSLSGLTIVLWRVSKIDPSRMWKSFQILAALMTLIVVMISTITIASIQLSKYKNIENNIKLLSYSMTLIGASLAGMLVAAMALTRYGNGFAAAFIFTTLSASIIAIISALSVLAVYIRKSSGKNGIQPATIKKLANVVISVMLTMSVILGALTVLTRYGNVNKSIQVIGVITASIISILLTISLMPKFVKPEAIKSLSKALQSIVLPLLGISLSLAIIIASVTTMKKTVKSASSTNWTDILNGLAKVMLLLAAMALVITGFAFLAKLTSGPDMLMAAGSVLLLSLGIMALVDAVSAMKNVNWADMLNGLAKASVLILGLSAVMLLMSAVAPIILVGATALFFLAAGLKIVFEVLSAIASTGSSNIKQGLEVIGEILRSIIDNILVTVINRIQYLIDMLYDNIDKIIGFIERLSDPIIEVIIKLLAALIQFLTDPTTLAELVNAIVTIIGMVLDEIVNLTDKIIGTIIGVINAIADRVWEISDSIGRLISEIMKSIADAAENYLPTILADFTRLLTTLIYELAYWMTSAPFIVGTAFIKGIWNGIKDGLGVLLKDIKTIGKDIVEGLKDGITSAWHKVTDIVENLGKKVVNGFKKIFNINSPSKVMKEMGEYIDEGLAIGIEESATEVEDATESLKDAITDNLNASVIRDALDAANEIVDDGLVITPVLDLTEIQNGAIDLASLLSSISGDAISVSGSMSGLAADELRATNELKNRAEYGNTTTNNSTTIENTFNISGSDDPQAVAEEVSRQIQRDLERRKISWGR